MRPGPVNPLYRSLWSHSSVNWTLFQFSLNHHRIEILVVVGASLVKLQHQVHHHPSAPIYTLCMCVHHCCKFYHLRRIFHQVEQEKTTHRLRKLLNRQTCSSLLSPTFKGCPLEISQLEFRLPPSDFSCKRRIFTNNLLVKEFPRGGGNSW